MRHVRPILGAGLAAVALLAAAAAGAQSFPRLYCTNNPADPNDCQILGVDNPIQNLGLGTPLGAQISPDAQYLYVANNFGDTYSILSIQTPSRVSPVIQVNTPEVNCFPVDVAVVGNKLYLACFGPNLVGTRFAEGHIEVFVKGPSDPYIQAPAGRIDLDPDPNAIDTEPFTSITDILASADGRHLYVAYIEEQTCGPFRFQFGSFAIVRTDTDQVTDRFPDLPLCGRGNQEMLEPLNLALSPDGRRLYASLHKSFPPHVAELAVSATGAAFTGNDYTRINLCSDSSCSNASDEDSKDPAGLLLSADGSKLYVTHNGLTGIPRFRISVVNTASRTVSRRIDLPGAASPSFIDYNPTAPAFTRDGSKLLVPLFGDDSNLGDHIAVVNTGSDTLDLAATITVPVSAQFDGGTQRLPQPVSVLLHPTQPFAYSVNNLPDTITVLQTELLVPEFGLGTMLIALAGLGVLIHRSRTASGGRRADHSF
jgi:DNA-binding beta-propeller fold protein YncE